MCHDHIIKLAVLDGVGHDVATVSDPEVAVGGVEEGREARRSTEEGGGNGAAVGALGGDTGLDRVEGLDGGGTNKRFDSVSADDEVGGDGGAGSEVSHWRCGVGDGGYGGVESDLAA